MKNCPELQGHQRPPQNHQRWKTKVIKNYLWWFLGGTLMKLEFRTIFLFSLRQGRFQHPRANFRTPRCLGSQISYFSLFGMLPQGLPPNKRLTLSIISYLKASLNNTCRKIYLFSGYLKTVNNFLWNMVKRKPYLGLGQPPWYSGVLWVATHSGVCIALWFNMGLGPKPAIFKLSQIKFSVEFLQNLISNSMKL